MKRPHDMVTFLELAGFQVKVKRVTTVYLHGVSGSYTHIGVSLARHGIFGDSCAPTVTKALRYALTDWTNKITKRG